MLSAGREGQHTQHKATTTTNTNTPHPTRTYIRRNQIRNISILGPIILLMRLRNHTLEHLAVLAATATTTTTTTITNTTSALGTILGVVVAVELVARVCRHATARPRGGGGGRRLGGGLAVPGYVGEGVLVDDGHFGGLGAGGRWRAREEGADRGGWMDGWMGGCLVMETRLG